MIWHYTSCKSMQQKSLGEGTDKWDKWGCKPIIFCKPIFLYSPLLLSRACCWGRRNQVPSHAFAIMLQLQLSSFTKDRIAHWYTFSREMNLDFRTLRNSNDFRIFPAQISVVTHTKFCDFCKFGHKVLPLFLNTMNFSKFHVMKKITRFWPCITVALLPEIEACLAPGRNWNFQVCSTPFSVEFEIPFKLSVCFCFVLKIG